MYCHRRYGKSFVLFAIATEVGLGKAPEVWPDLARIVRFMAPTMLDLEEIYLPIAEDLFLDCPPEIVPTWRATQGRGHFFFPTTGSRLYLFGVDAKHYRKARGKKCHLAVPDEVGSCQPGHPGGIEHVVNAIVMPQTLGVNGRIVMPTTPPETPGHPSVLLRAQCQAAGAFIRRRIQDTEAELQELFGEGIVDEYARECGGRESTTFRREYGCEEVVDETRAAVPEFTAHRDAIVREPEIPAYFIPLVSMDVGFKPDPTHALFGCWDFLRAKLLVFAEWYETNALTDLVAKGVRDTEAATWPWEAKESARDEYGAYVFEPWRRERREARRFSDTDLRLIADLKVMHGILFSPTRKDNKEAQVNELRMLVRDERLEIHPRCVHLVRSLETTVWDKAHAEWERTVDGHGDGVDATLYMLRNAPRSVNPYPPKYADLDPRTVFLPPEGDAARNRSPLTQAVTGLFRKGSS